MADDTAKGSQRNGAAAPPRRRWLVALAFALAAGIFAVDLFTPLDGAVAVLYIAVILLLAPLGRRFVVAAGLGSVLLAIAAFIGGHLYSPTGGAYTRVAVSLVAIVITTLLSLRDRSTRTTLGEQARLLELSHDTVIIRAKNDTILYWNDGAEELYGWTRAEALGRTCSELLKCDYPDQVTATLEAEGQWSGEVVRTRRDGTRLVLASRWLLRRDPEGRPVGVIESSADLTESRRADAQRQASEQRYRTMFDAAGFAAWEGDWSRTMQLVREAVPAGEPLDAWLAAHPEAARAAIDAAAIRMANPAAAELFGAATAAVLDGSALQGRYVPAGLPGLAQILATLASGARAAEAETCLQALDGRVVDVVLRVTVLPEGEDGSQVLVMAVDLTERNETRARLEQTSAELAHAARVSTLGQLAASIAHEVNQPLTAIITFGKSGKRWLSRPEPDLAEVAGCLDRIVGNGTRAADVIGRVRALARKTAPQAELLSLPDLVDDAVTLLQRDARAADVTIRKAWRRPPPPVWADRVQVQQVLVNLVMNGVQAMREVEGRKRELGILAEALPDGTVRLSVQDSGTGFADGDAERIFTPFFTTKAEGMGMGLSICRSIIESQGGRISARNNDGHGATVSFTLPTAPPAPAKAPEFIS